MNIFSFNKLYGYRESGFIFRELRRYSSYITYITIQIPLNFKQIAINPIVLLSFFLYSITTYILLQVCALCPLFVVLPRTFHHLYQFRGTCCELKCVSQKSTIQNLYNRRGCVKESLMPIIIDSSFTYIAVYGRFLYHNCLCVKFNSRLTMRDKMTKKGNTW